MIYPRPFFEDLRWVTEFTVTDEHLKLLRHAHVTWHDAEWGSPAIDCKRPYGTSDPWSSMAEILGVPPVEWVDSEGGAYPDVQERFARLHAEAGMALQIALATGEFRVGRYMRQEDFPLAWRRVG